MGAKKMKPGQVIRVDPLIQSHLKHKARGKETKSATLRRLLGLPPRRGVYVEPQVFYILPESRIVCQTMEEARGEAIVRAVKKGEKKPTEKPIAVRVLE